MSVPWSRADAASYDDVAPAFDRFAESFSASFAERLVRNAALAEGEAALDVATAFATSWMLGEASAYYWSPRRAR